MNWLRDAMIAGLIGLSTLVSNPINAKPRVVVEQKQGSYHTITYSNSTTTTYQCLRSPGSEGLRFSGISSGPFLTAFYATLKSTEIQRVLVETPFLEQIFIERKDIPFQTKIGLDHYNKEAWRKHGPCTFSKD